MLIVLQKLFRKNKHVILILAQNSKSKKSKFNKDTNFHGINLHRLTHFNFLLTRRIYSLPVPQRKLFVFIKASKFMLFGLIVRECILCVLNIHAIVLSLLLRKALFFCACFTTFLYKRGKRKWEWVFKEGREEKAGKKVYITQTFKYNRTNVFFPLNTIFLYSGIYINKRLITQITR